MHCFVEDWDTAKQAMDMNFYISYSGIVPLKMPPVCRRWPDRYP
jgi:Mg-dependent DNase